MKNLTHLDNNNRVNMVDVSRKGDILRVAEAEGKIILAKHTLELIKENKIRKGNVLTTAELAGIMGAKKTSELIPLCHNIFLSNIHVQAELEDSGVIVRSQVYCVGKTGVEMEALTAVNIALLAIYDMCKAVDKNMVITDIKLLYKKKSKI